MRKIICLVYFTLLSFSIGLSQQLAPSIEWQKSLGGSKDDIANAIIKTADNGFLVAGSSKSNDGDVSGHHGSTDTTDAWIVKLSSSGSIEWQKSLGGTANDVFNSVIITSDGSYLCMGTTASHDGDVSGNHGGTDIWMVKLSRSGAVLWSKCFGGGSNELAGNLRQNKDGSICVIGSTFSNDGDVSGLHIPANGFSDIWVMKISDAGVIIWQKCYGGSLPDLGYDIAETADGGFFIAAEVESNDGDFGIGGGNPPRGYIIRIDSTKAMVVKSLLQQSTPIQLFQGSDGYFYANYDELSCYPMNPDNGIRISRFTDVAPGSVSFLASYTWCKPLGDGLTPLGYKTSGPSGLVSFNNGTDIVIAASSDDSLHNTGFHGGINDGFISGIKTANGPSWTKMVGGSGVDFFKSIALVNSSEFVVAGHSNSNNGDVSGNHGGYDAWIVRFGQVNFIRGSVYLDYNLNGIKDANEPFAKNIIVQSLKSTEKAASLTLNGVFSNSVDTGSYTSSIVSPVMYYTPVPSSRISTFSSYNNTDSISFALQPIPGKRDYAVSLVNYTRVRPGTDITFRIQVVNLGTDTLVNRTVKLFKDPRFAFISSAPVQAGISGDTITWLVSSLQPRDTGFISLQLKAATPPVLTNGDYVSNMAFIDSTGDLSPSNNTSGLLQLVHNSYDPNDKQENAGGAFSSRDLGNNKYLVYTIRFQNTGNDTAFNITVTDTLDVKSDWSTVEMVDASHSYHLAIKNGNQLKWTFDNISLVDSIHNEPGSHGYLVYRVKPLSNLQPGDSIRNSAAIYFDFNPGVKTNTQVTVITAPASPMMPVVSGFQNNYCSGTGLQKIKINNLPLPVGDITVLVKLDAATVINVGADSIFTFNPSLLTAGNHTIDISFSNGIETKTTSANFSITATSVPDVHLFANITTVVNLADPVMVTATNIAGGGTAPKYSFAKDFSFVNVLQAESNNNTLTVQPNTLAVGNNRIYAKMKTSDTCFISQTDIDSIDIQRSAITGLTDVDFPGQTINVYPNPFSATININGLNTGKTYIVTISNAAGQKIYSQQITNSRNAIISKAGLPDGKYWISIYDYKKHILIGTALLIKAL